MDVNITTADRDLNAVLNSLETTAADLLPLPLRPVSDNLKGYIEAIWPERPGIVWITGWMANYDKQELSVVIGDRRKYAGAIAMACYSRSDLPANSSAFVALLRSDWQPSRDTNDVFMFFGEKLQNFLRSVPPLKIIDGNTFAQQFSSVEAYCHAGRAAALRNALLSGQSWVTDSANLSGANVRSATDDLLILPGFGCFVQGWLLSTTKQLVKISVKLSDKILHSIPGSLYFTQRDDLSSVMPNAHALTKRAGFAAALQGAVQAEDLINPIVKTWFSDGTSTNFVLDPLSMRRLGHAAPYDSVFRIYPGLTDESFFPDFMSAVSSELESNLGYYESLCAQKPEKRCVIASVPKNMSDARLFIDNIAYLLKLHKEEVPVVLLADRGFSRAYAPMLTKALSSAGGANNQIMLVDDTSRPLFATKNIINNIKAERIVFLRSGAFLRSHEWQACMSALKGDMRELFLLSEDGNFAAFAGEVPSFVRKLAPSAVALGTKHFQCLTDVPRATLKSDIKIILDFGQIDKLVEKIDEMRLSRREAYG